MFETYCFEIEFFIFEFLRSFIVLCFVTQSVCDVPFIKLAPQINASRIGVLMSNMNYINHWQRQLWVVMSHSRTCLGVFKLEVILSYRKCLRKLTQFPMSHCMTVSKHCVCFFLQISILRNFLTSLYRFWALLMWQCINCDA